MKSSNCIEQRNTAESESPGGQQAVKINSNRTWYAPHFHQDIDSIYGDSAHNRPQAEIQQKLCFMFYSNYKKHQHTCSRNHQNSRFFFHVYRPSLFHYMKIHEKYSRFRINFPFGDYTDSNPIFPEQEGRCR